jgi:hypothetical protein
MLYVNRVLCHDGPKVRINPHAITSCLALSFRF